MCLSARTPRIFFSNSAAHWYLSPEQNLFEGTRNNEWLGDLFEHPGKQHTCDMILQFLLF